MRTSSCQRSAALVVMLSWAWPGSVAAQPTLEQQPWAVGVSEERKDRARKLHLAGNRHLEEGDYEPARAIFESALAEWDHPGIRYNMAIALFRLNRLVDAYENLLAALRHGPDPLPPEVYTQAQDYKRLLEQAVAPLTIACRAVGARVTVDGKYVFTGPDEVELFVSTGEHLVVAQTPDRRTVIESVRVEPHRQNRIQLDRWPTEIGIEVIPPRFDPWKPWAVAGAGAVALLVGAPLQWRAQANIDAFDAAVVQASCHMDPDGCQRVELPAAFALHDRAQFQHRMALASFALGGIALVGGVALVIYNRPRTREVPRVVVYPEVSGDRALVWSALRF